MICLFIDTSISYPTVSVIKDNEVLFEFHEEIKSDMSSEILPIIDKAVKETKLSLNLIDKLFVVNGPGSFTGVRIGVTIAKTIAWALKIPVIPISSLEFIATTETSKKYAVPMIDARRNNVFMGIYDNELNSIEQDSLININNILDRIGNNYELISYDNIENCIKPSPNVLRVINKHMNDEGVNAHKLKSNYLKLTEAEENRLIND